MGGTEGEGEEGEVAEEEEGTGHHPLVDHLEGEITHHIR